MPFIRIRPLHSEEIEEIIGQIPPSLVRMGTAGLFFLVLILVFASMLIRYPTVVNARAGIYPDQKPFTVEWASQSANHTDIRVQSGATVKAGDTLTIKTTAGQPPVYCVSPISGKVEWVRGSAESPADNTLVVEPAAQAYSVSLYIDQDQADDIKPGQPVSIQVDNYGQSRFGTLDGRVISLSKTVVRKQRVATVGLTNGLSSSRGKLFNLGRALKGDAEITTANRTIFQIIFKRN